MEFGRPWLLAESFLPFVQAAWRRREGETRGVGSAVSASVVRRGGGGKPSSPANDSVRGALGDSHATLSHSRYYSGDLDTKGPAPHEAGGCKASYCWNRFHAAALRIAWHKGGPRWGAILAILVSTPLQNGQRGGSLFRASGMR